MIEYLQIIFLAIALSIDSFAIALGYGIGKSKISKKSILIISFTSVIVLAVSLAVGEIVRGFIPVKLTSIFSFLVLFCLGLVKLLQKSDELIIKKLNVTESFIMGFSMAIDSLAAGIGADIGRQYITFTLAVVFAAGYLAVYLGNKIGFKLSHSIKHDVSKLGSICIILIAFTKLM